MEVHSDSYEPTAPLSPALTNPDMILPYRFPRNISPSPRRMAGRAVPAMRFIDLIKIAEKRNWENGFGTPNMRLTEGDLQNGQSPPSPSSPMLRNDGTSVAGVHNEYKERDGGHWSASDFGNAMDDDKLDQKKCTNTQDREIYLGGKTMPGSPETVLVPETDEPDTFSTTAMGMRAEEILANAKKRLTEMEDNLSRARRSLIVSSSTSKSALVRSSSQPLSFLTEGRQSKDSWTIALPKKRQDNSGIIGGYTGGHSRVLSETSLPSAFSSSTIQLHEVNQHHLRASSAMGSVSAGYEYYDQGESGSPHTNYDGLRSLKREVVTGRRRNGALEPLHEDELTLCTDETVSPPDDSPFSQHDSTHNQSRRAVFNASYYDVKRSRQELTRARSNIQLRDLRDQMQDLRGKLTSLKQRTREDNLQRRSMQTLKTPSPFTVAKDWIIDGALIQVSTFTSPDDEGKVLNGSQELSTLDSSTSRTKPQEIAIATENINEPDAVSASLCNGTPQSTGNSKMDEAPMNKRESDSLFVLLPDADKTISTGSTSGPLLLPVGERHEDRPDAFDYEHYFLHSGMGTFSRNRSWRSDSESSYDSAETTKPGIVVREESSEFRDDRETNSVIESSVNTRKHSRHNSGASTSTVATFTTAIEGNVSEKESELPKSYDTFTSTSWQPQRATRAQQPMQSQISRTIDHPPKSLTSSAPTMSAPKDNFDASSGLHDDTSLNPSEASSLGLADFLRLIRTCESQARWSSADEQLIRDLLQSLESVCKNLAQESNEGNYYETKILKRRLDTARRILDGDIDSDEI